MRIRSKHKKDLVSELKVVAQGSRLPDIASKAWLTDIALEVGASSVTRRRSEKQKSRGKFTLSDHQFGKNRLEVCKQRIKGELGLEDSKVSFRCLLAGFLLIDTVKIKYSSFDIVMITIHVKDEEEMRLIFDQYGEIFRRHDIVDVLRVAAFETPDDKDKSYHFHMITIYPDRHRHSFLYHEIEDYLSSFNVEFNKTSRLCSLDVKDHNEWNGTGQPSHVLREDKDKYFLMKSLLGAYGLVTYITKGLIKSPTNPVLISPSLVTASNTIMASTNKSLGFTSMFAREKAMLISGSTVDNVTSQLFIRNPKKWGTMKKSKRVVEEKRDLLVDQLDRVEAHFTLDQAVIRNVIARKHHSGSSICITKLRTDVLDVWAQYRGILLPQCAVSNLMTQLAS